jgi:hypothetical protein
MSGGPPSAPLGAANALDTTNVHPNPRLSYSMVTPCWVGIEPPGSPNDPRTKCYIPAPSSQPAHLGFHSDSPDC